MNKDILNKMAKTLEEWIKALIQKAVLLDTARIVRTFLSLEPEPPPVAWNLLPTPVEHLFLIFSNVLIYCFVLEYLFKNVKQ